MNQEDTRIKPSSGDLASRTPATIEIEALAG
jgi:hypothetical protein